jgi:hypothetical protein
VSTPYAIFSLPVSFIMCYISSFHPVRYVLQSSMSMLGVAIEDILRAAEMGRRLAVRLLTLDDRDDRLDKKLCSLSKDVASTGVVLEQVALQLNQEESLRLFSAKSVALLKKLVDDCTTTFTELEEAVSGSVPTAARLSDVHLLQEQHEKVNFLLGGYLQHSKLVLLKTSLRVLLDVYRNTAEGLRYDPSCR